MESNLKKSVRIAITMVVLALPLIALTAVHILFAQAAEAEIRRRGVDEGYHNAVKHAFAASEFYALARLVAGADRAQTIVISLGELNEWLERYIRHETDVTTEVYKDLRNNIAGIAAAEWMYGQDGYVSPCMRLKLIGKLAEAGDLAAWAEDRRIPALPPGYETLAAIERAEADAPALRAAFDASLAAKSAELRADLGL